MPGDLSKPSAIAAILLASGFSKRFGKRNKLLVPFRNKPLARYTLELATAMDFSGGVYFITASDDVAALASDLSAVKVIKNNNPDKGLRESIRLGVEAAGLGVGYYIFFLCDQPFLDAGSVQKILDAGQHGCIVEPRCRAKPEDMEPQGNLGPPGAPCLFSADFREELISLGEGETPRIIKSRHPEALRVAYISNPLALEDIDDEKTLKRFLQPD